MVGPELLKDSRRILQERILHDPSFHILIPLKIVEDTEWSPVTFLLFREQPCQTQLSKKLFFFHSYIRPGRNIEISSFPAFPPKPPHARDNSLRVVIQNHASLLSSRCDVTSQIAHTPSIWQTDKDNLPGSLCQLSQKLVRIPNRP